VSALSWLDAMPSIAAGATPHSVPVRNRQTGQHGVVVCIQRSIEIFIPRLREVVPCSPEWVYDLGERQGFGFVLTQALLRQPLIWKPEEREAARLMWTNGVITDDDRLILARTYLGQDLRWRSEGVMNDNTFISLGEAVALATDVAGTEHGRQWARRLVCRIVANLEPELSSEANARLGRWVARALHPNEVSP